MIKCEDHLGNIFDSEAEMCKFHGVEPNTYNWRKHQGMPLSSCLRPAADRGVIYKGKKYKNLSQCCIEYNVPYATVYQRMQRGQTLDFCINVLLEKKKKLNKAS